MKYSIFFLFFCSCFLRIRSNEYWADGNGSPENNYEDSGEQNEGQGGGGGEEGNGHQEVTPPEKVEVVQEADGESTTEATHQEQCQFNDLVKCLADPLDEWAVALYNLKENIVAIGGEACLTHREQIRKCIEELAPSFHCDHANILAVAERVTDLLVHKKNSGNLLRSYYVTGYVCTEEGRALRDEVGDHCLKTEHMGEMVFDAVRYMDEKISHNHTANGHQLCAFLRERALLMRSIGETKCTDHSAKAGRLMCDTIKTAFLTMYPQKFKDCTVECPKDAGSISQNGDGGQGGDGGDVPDQGAHGNGGQTGANHGGKPDPGGTDQPNGSPTYNMVGEKLLLALTTTAVLLRYGLLQRLCL